MVLVLSQQKKKQFLLSLLLLLSLPKTVDDETSKLGWFVPVSKDASRHDVTLSPFLELFCCAAADAAAAAATVAAFGRLGTDKYDHDDNARLDTIVPSVQDQTRNHNTNVACDFDTSQTKSYHKNNNNHAFCAS